MNRFRPTLLAAAVGAGLCGLVLPAHAQDAPLTQDQMQRLLLEQAARIEALERRLADIDAGAAAPAAAPATGEAATRAQVDAAIADTSAGSDLALLQAQVAQLAAAGGGDRTSWRRGGPEFRSPDGAFTFHPRGRVLADFSSTHGSEYDARNINGTEMRQVRLGAEGTMGPLRYKIDAELSDNQVSISDAYVAYNSTLGSLPVEYYFGNKLKDRAIDSSTTLTRVPFMERNAVATVGMPISGYFGLGAQMKLYGSNWHWSLGATGDDVGNTGDESDGFTVSTRAHWNPIKRSQGFVHLGGWYFHEDVAASASSLNRVPRIGQNFNDNLRVSASSISGVTDNHAYGLELGGVYRNLWAFGEYTQRTINSATVESVDHAATSIYAGWLITGEAAAFTTRSGVWGTTRVLNPVTEGGWGAFELATRYDNYDFTDAPRGGEGSSYTLGLNWYLNNWSRLMFNVVRWRTDNQVGAYQGRDTGHSIGVRAQVVF